MKTLMLVMAIVMGALGARGVVYNPRLGAYYATITQAVAAAASGDRLHISTGIYAETIWISSNGVTLAGGYATNGTTRIANARSVVTDGGVRVRDARGVSVEWLLITGVVNGIALDVRDGASVTCNHTQIKYNRGTLLGQGGGVVVRYGSYALLSNVMVSANTAPQRGGGALVLANSALVLKGYSTQVDGNSAPVGGGVSVEDRATLVIDGAAVYANTAAQGGGVYLSNSTLVVRGEGGSVGWEVADYNVATNGAGGGVYAWQSLVIVSNRGVITKNLSSGDGGGIYANNSHVYFGDAVLGAPTSNQANRTRTGSGGGVYLVESTAVFERSTIEANYAESGGGVQLAGGAMCVCSNTTIRGNIALSGGGINSYWRQNACLIEGGLIISNQAADSSPGGGMDVDTSFGGSFTGVIRGCVVQGNQAGSGGGVYLRGGTLLMEDTDLLGNAAVYDGGAVATRGGALTLRNTRARLNAAREGGAISAVSGGEPVNVLLEGGEQGTNVFSENVATNGGAWFVGVRSHATVLGNVEMVANVARHEGGAIYMTNTAGLAISCTNGTRAMCAANAAGARGGAIAVHGRATLDAQGLACVGNTSGQHGGGIFVNGGTVMVHYDQPVADSVIPANVLHGNAAGERGGGVCAWPASQVRLSESLFVTNSAKYGGGLYADGANVSLFNTLLVSNQAVVNGPNAFATQTSAVCVVHSTVAGANQAMALYYATRLVATNSIFWAFYPALSAEYGATALVCYSDIRGGWPGEGNMNADPCFVDPAACHYQLAVDSPCINTGINAGVSYDCVGTPRPYGRGYDMGAYEFVPEPGWVAVLFTICNLQFIIHRTQRESA